MSESTHEIIIIMSVRTSIENGSIAKYVSVTDGVFLVSIRYAVYSIFTPSSNEQLM